MAIQLNHTIVHTHDKQAESRFVTDVLGLPAATPFGPFAVVELQNGVSLDFMNVDGEITQQHYAFLISEEEFDVVSKRLHDRGAQTWADPMQKQPGFNTNDGGRGLYFESPDGHLLEVITRPYGSGS
jgi:catechol 2,3-dioxygenase-like lactoylglutathione lyase family enzyme